MAIIAGIDYSLTCPAICVYDTTKNNFNYKNTSIYFRSNLNRFKCYSNEVLSGENHGVWNSDEDRYDDISNWAMTIITQKHDVDSVIIEGYSYGSTGKVFHIAENTAILKYNLWDSRIPFTIVPPTMIKKYATGKGNANKVKMHDHFLKDNPTIDLPSMLTPKSNNIISPVGDIVDAYYITKYGLSILTPS